MTKTYELPNEKMIMADIDEKHHTATISVYALDDLVEAINKTGNWIAVENEEMETIGYYCSECDLPMETENQTRFCPNCGAKMVEPQESEASE